MNIFKKIGNWLLETVPPLATVVKSVQKLIDTGQKVKEMYDVGLEILEREKTRDENKPNIIINIPSQPVPTPILTLYPHPKENKKRDDKAIQEIRKQQYLAEEAQKRLLLQTKILELLTTSQTIERFTDNIGIHVANLNIHYISLKNTMGLLDVVNRQNKGLKAVISKVNYMIRLRKQERWAKGEQLEEISNIDLERKQGTITILGQYNAFAQTQKLLEIESGKLIEFDRQTTRASRRIRNVRKKFDGKGRSDKLA